MPLDIWPQVFKTNSQRCPHGESQNCKVCDYGDNLFSPTRKPFNEGDHLKKNTVNLSSKTENVDLDLVQPNNLIHRFANEFAFTK